MGGGDAKIPIEDSNDPAMHLLRQNNAQNLKNQIKTLPFTKDDTKYLEKMSQLLEIDDSSDQTFLSEYNSTCEKFKNNGLHLLLLTKAVEKEKSYEILIAIKRNYIKTKKHMTEKDENLIAAMCKTRNKKALTLICHNFLEKEAIIKVIIQQLDKDLFDDWFDSVIDDKNYIISAKYHDRLLETALKQKHQAAIIKLCKAGAFLGYKYVKDKYERTYLIDEMDKTVLTEIFDSCITPNNYSKTSDDFKIDFNYINFAPIDHNTSSGAEMATIGRIVNNEDLLDLLQHPLITSYMTLRWTKIARIFLLQFILFCFYGISMVTYILAMCEKATDSFLNYARCFTAFGILFLIIRETIQFYVRPKQYIQKISNYMEIVLIVLSVKVLMIDFKLDESKIIIVITVLLMAWELVFLIGYFPILSIATHILMLQEVLKTFLQSFSLYSIFVLTFVVCFRVLFEDGKKKEAKIENINTESRFQSLFPLFVKTMAMVSGELDFENLQLKNIYSYLLVLLFVICMTVVLMNLLNGLAVSDIQIIKKNAQLNGLICRAKLLGKTNVRLFISRANGHRICRCTYKLTVQPNYNSVQNKVTFQEECKCASNLKSKKHVVPPMITAESKTHISSSRNRESKTNVVLQIIDSFRGTCTVMESNIVKDAMKNINNNMIRKDDSSSEETRLRKIEESITSIANSLKSLKKMYSAQLKKEAKTKSRGSTKHLNF